MATRTIVLGLDGSECSDAARAWTLEHAPLLDAQVVAVYVIDPMLLAPNYAAVAGSWTFDEQLQTQMQEAINAWSQPLADQGLLARAAVVHGPPAAALSDLAVQEGASLVVVGRRGSGGFAELLLGSVPHALAHHCRVPVVIVPID